MFGHGHLASEAVGRSDMNRFRSRNCTGNVQRHQNSKVKIARKRSYMTRPGFLGHTRHTPMTLKSCILAFFRCCTVFLLLSCLLLAMVLVSAMLSLFSSTKKQGTGIWKHCLSNYHLPAWSQTAELFLGTSGRVVLRKPSDVALQCVCICLRQGQYRCLILVNSVVPDY